MKLEVIDLDGRKFRIYWVEDGDPGGHLCQSPGDGLGDPPEDRDEWEHWSASKAVRNAPGIEFDASGGFWHDDRLAAAALKMARLALTQERELPDWAKRALSEGWKPPSGWKA